MFAQVYGEGERYILFEETIDNLNIGSEVQ